MSVTITFQQFDKKKTDALWDDVFSGNYEKNIAEKKEELENQLPTLGAKIPKYSGEELDFMLYTKDIKLGEYDKTTSEYEKVRDLAFQYKLKLVGLNEFKERIQNKDKKEILYAIADLDANLMSECGKNFADSAYAYELFSEILFENTIDFVLEENQTLSDIPFDIWINAFKHADRNAMQQIKEGLEESEECTFEEFSECILQIKDLVKLCLETNTEMIVFYDVDSSEFQKKRAEELYDKVKAWSIN